jgi:hypothetical protein
VVDGWCLFFNEGCVLHKVGAADGDKWRYKPWRCVAFPLDQTETGNWHVRQWNSNGEAWNLFCLNPAESPRPATESLVEEIGFVERLESGEAAERGFSVAASTEVPRKPRPK